LDTELSLFMQQLLAQGVAAASQAARPVEATHLIPRC